MKKHLAFLLITILLVCAMVPPAQVRAQSGGISLHLEQVDTTIHPSVTLRLNAWDASGLPLEQLEAQNFSLREDDGAPFHPQSVQTDTQAPLGIVLALDVSGSMSGAPLADAKTAAARFLDRLQPDDRAALVAFSDPVNTDPASLNPQRELAFSSDLAPAYDLIEGLSAQGQTQLYNAEAKAARLAAALPVGHRAVLLLSDGRNDPAEIGNPEEAIQLARGNNIPFFVIGLGDQIDEAHLRRLASETGGLYRSAPSSSELARLFSETATLLKTQYLLSYQSSLAPDAAKHMLSVSLNTALGQADGKIQFGPLPAAPTASPLPSATAVPQPTPTLAPTLAPQPVQPRLPEPEPKPTWAWPLAAAVSLGVGLLVLMRSRKRRPAPAPESCAQCGFNLTGKPGACPQCGSTRRLPKGK